MKRTRSNPIRFLDALAAFWEKDAGSIAALAILTLICFLPLFQAGFVYDDHALILGNPLVTKSGIAAWQIFAQPFPWEGNSFSFYRPLQVLCYRLNAFSAPPSAFWFHAVNVAIHILVTALFFLLCKRIFRETASALAAAMLFAFLPAHAEAVCWVSARGDLLIGLTGVLILLLLAGGRRDQGRDILLVSLSFGLGLLVKESAAVFLPLVFALRLGQENGAAKALGRWKRASVSLLAMLLVFAAYWLIRSLVLGHFLKTINEIEGLTFLQRLALTGRMLWRGFSNLAYLARPTVDYHWADGAMLNGEAVGGWLLLALASLAWLLLKNRNLRIGMAILACGFLPFAHIFYSCETYAERYSYLPSLGFCIVIAEGLRWFRRRANPRLLAVLVTIWIFTMGVITHNYAKAWKDDLALWSHAIRLSPGSPQALRNYGTSLLNRGDWRQALTVFRGLQEIPRHDLPARILQLRALGQGRAFREGVQLARASLGRYPNSAELHFLYGRHLLRTGARSLAQKEVGILGILSRGHPQNKVLFKQLQNPGKIFRQI